MFLASSIDDDIARPDYNAILSANSHGKRVLAVKHRDEKVRKGCFLAYNYGETYTFKKSVVEKSVHSFVMHVFVPVYNVNQNHRLQT